MPLPSDLIVRPRRDSHRNADRQHSESAARPRRLNVKTLFERHGTVESVKLINDRETGKPRGFGFVALIFACVNIFGGFLVTQRMLAMYKKKQK